VINYAAKDERKTLSTTIENETTIHGGAAVRKSTKRRLLAMLVADASVSSREYVSDYRAGRGAE